VYKCGRARQATDDSIMLDNCGYRHALRICNTYWSSVAKIVSRTLLIVTFILALSLLLSER
jgi:hypothetical protein